MKYLLCLKWHPPSPLHLELTVLTQTHGRRHAASNDDRVAQPTLYRVRDTLKVVVRNHPSARRSRIAKKRIDFAGHPALEGDSGTDSDKSGERHHAKDHCQHSAHRCLHERASAISRVTSSRPFTRTCAPEPTPNVQ